MEHTVNYTALTKYILSLILTITTISCFCQVEQNKFADSVIIYIGFYSGGTTADLRWNSDAVDTMKTVIKTKLSKNYLDTLNFLIEQIKPHRHHQQKVGPSNYACVFQNGRSRTNPCFILNHYGSAIVFNGLIFFFNKVKICVKKLTFPSY